MIAPFDPRTLPGGDWVFNLGFFLWFAANLADVFLTRWAVWERGFTEANRLMRWFIDRSPRSLFGIALSPDVRTFLDGILRLALCGVFMAASLHYEVVDRAHSWVPWGLFVVALVPVAINVWRLWL